MRMSDWFIPIVKYVAWAIVAGTVVIGGVWLIARWL